MCLVEFLFGVIFYLFDFDFFLVCKVDFLFCDFFLFMMMGVLLFIVVVGECCFVFREEVVVVDGFWFVVEIFLVVGVMVVWGEVFLNFRFCVVVGWEGDIGFFLEVEVVVMVGCCCDVRLLDRLGGSMEERGLKMVMLIVVEGYVVIVMFLDILCVIFGNKR